MTVGENLAANLGIDIINYKAVIQRSMNTSQAIYRVSINSRYPNKQLLYSQLRKLDSIKVGYYGSRSDNYKAFKWTPPYILSMFDSPIPSNAIIIFIDISAEYMIDRNMYEAKVVGNKGRVILRKLDESKLEEFTISDFKNNISDITKYWSKQRTKVAGQDTRLTKMIEFREPGIFVFLTEPTYEPRMPIYPKGKKGGTDNSYTLMIQVKDFDKWFPDPLKITYKEFIEVLKVADILLDSDDASFQLQGFRKQLQDLDSAIYPTNAPDKGIWAKRHGGALLSKHLYWLLHYINFHMPAMFRKMKDYYLSKYGQPTYTKSAPRKIKTKKRSADDIVPRK